MVRHVYSCQFRHWYRPVHTTSSLVLPQRYSPGTRVFHQAGGCKFVLHELLLSCLSGHPEGAIEVESRYSAPSDVSVRNSGVNKVSAIFGRGNAAQKQYKRWLLRGHLCLECCRHHAAPSSKCVSSGFACFVCWRNTPPRIFIEGAGCRNRLSAVGMRKSLRVKYTGAVGAHCGEQMGYSRMTCQVDGEASST